MNPELVQNEDGTWSLKSLSDASVALGPYQRLIDAIYERERVRSGATPPFGRWVIHGVEEVEPIRFDGESDEQMQSPTVVQNELLLRDWEYEELVVRANALGLLKAHEETYSDEFETKFHYAVQQRSISPFLRDSTDSKFATSNSHQTDEEKHSEADRDIRPFYKKHPIIFWTLIGVFLTALGNFYRNDY